MITNHPHIESEASKEESDSKMIVGGGRVRVEGKVGVLHKVIKNILLRA